MAPRSFTRSSVSPQRELGAAGPDSLQPPLLQGSTPDIGPPSGDPYEGERGRFLPALPSCLRFSAPRAHPQTIAHPGLYVPQSLPPGNPQQRSGLTIYHPMKQRVFIRSCRKSLRGACASAFLPDSLSAARNRSIKAKPQRSFWALRAPCKWRPHLQAGGAGRQAWAVYLQTHISRIRSRTTAATLGVPGSVGRHHSRCHGTLESSQSLHKGDLCLES